LVSFIILFTWFLPHQPKAQMNRFFYSFFSGFHASVFFWLIWICTIFLMTILLHNRIAIFIGHNSLGTMFTSKNSTKTLKQERFFYNFLNIKQLIKDRLKEIHRLTEKLNFYHQNYLHD
ncbi:hypothetical protein ACJX0J_014914, partial [Zea mays]